MNGKQAIEIVRATGRSQAEVARLIGVSPTAMQKWICGGDLHGTTASLLMMVREFPETLNILERLKGSDRKARKARA